LKRDMVTFSLEAPLPTYLRKRGLKVEWLKGELSRLEMALGFLPFADSVRMTISLAEMPTEVEGERVKLIIQDVLRPTGL